MSAPPINPQRGEIWLADLDPTVGAEIGKTRPVVVLNTPEVGRLPLRVIVPVTDWKPIYVRYPWMTLLEPDAANGLLKRSGADGFQVSSVDLQRFRRRLGSISAQQLVQIAGSVALVIGHEPPVAPQP
jgi:mRNA interferase MazF